MKYRYLGTAPGQSERIALCGLAWERGHVHDVDEDTAAILERKGGFEPAALADWIPGAPDDREQYHTDADPLAADDAAPPPDEAPGDSEDGDLED